jgi:ACS family hexuronate transporter-like MFS transporter
MPPLTIDRWRWGVVWLLFAATLINYTDRLALTNTQRYLLPEFEPDPAKQNKVYADILLSFGLAFGLFQLVAGFLVDRFSLRWIYVGAILLWSTAGIATGFVPAGAIGALMACRFFLGIGEAVNWPSAVACIRRVIPRESRGLANGIFHSGASIGAMATPFLVLLFVDPGTGRGWRSLFIAVGALGVIWALVWLKVTAPQERRTVIDSPPQPDPDAREKSEADRLPFVAAFRMRIFWICLVAGVSTNLCWHFYNQWFPRYLTQDLKVSATVEQWILAGFFIAADLGSLASGWSIRSLIRSGHSVERARKIVVSVLALAVIGATVPAAFLFENGPAMSAAELIPDGQPHPAPLGKIACFFVVAAAAMGGYAIVFQYAQDIIPRHTAQILGTMGCISWLVISGTSELIGRYDLAGPGKYGLLFVIVGLVPSVAAAFAWLWPEPKRAE